MNTSTKFLTPRNALFLLTVAKRIVPPVANLSQDEQLAVIQAVDTALGKRDAAMHKQFNMFLKVMRLSTIVPYAKAMDRLPVDKIDQKLRRFQDHPIEKLRLGFWGMKTMIYMGYYGDPNRYADFGYKPSMQGNEKLDD